MDDFSFSFSHLDILILSVKSLMKFDTFDGNHNLPASTSNLLIKSDLNEFLSLDIFQIHKKQK